MASARTTWQSDPAAFGDAGHAYVGRPTPRLEDLRLITGAGRFVADIDRPGQVWARVVRSQVAHARLREVHTGAAAASEGVLAAISARDIPGIDHLRLPIRGHLSGGYNAQATQPPLAVDSVRYFGEPIAIVVADDPYVAEDAAALVHADTEDLPVVLDPVLASSDGARELCPQVPRNIASEYHFDNGRPVAEVFRDADLVLRERFVTNRHSAYPLETRGLVAEFDAVGGRLTVWGPTKVKQTQLAALASLLGIPASRIRFLEPDVGGAFGVRGEFYSEDFLIPWLAIRLGRPVKWIEDRGEALVESNQSREHVFDVEMAVARDGRLLGLRSDSWCSMGGYLRSTGLVLPESSAMHLPGPYRWAALDVTAYAVLTNKTPAATFRGPGEVESTFVRERMLDMAATQLGLDPVELRRRNLVPAEAMPYSFQYGPGEHGISYESGDFPAQFEALLAHADYFRLRAEQARRGRSGELVGIGVACGLDESGHGPLEDARIVAEPDGAYTCYVGLASGGQGTATTMAQIAAEYLDVPIESVTVNFHDTDEIPVGYGASASRQTVMGGSAVVLAAEDLKRVARIAAAARLGIDPDDVELAGASARSGIDGRTVTLAELGCQGFGRFEKQDVDLSFCAALSLVVVDPGTGRLQIERYVGAYDVGRAINPITVEGLLEGAAAQGLGGVLAEESVYDAEGRPSSTTLMDYLMPTVAQLPEMESLVFQFPSQRNLLGAKGAAQNGIIATHAVVANAVADAIGRPSSVKRLPLRPHAVFGLIHGVPEPP